MAYFYVRSTDGINTNDGLTWATARATTLSATASAAVGDTVALSQASVESYAAETIIQFPNGTYANPIRVLSVADSAAPPTSLATTSTVNTTGASNLYLRGNAYIEGITFNIGNGYAYANAGINDASTTRMWLRNCALNLADTHPSSSWSVGGTGSGQFSETAFENCKFSCVHPNQSMKLQGAVKFIGGSVKAASVIPSNGYFAVGAPQRAATVTLDGFDFSAIGATGHLLQPLVGTAVLRNCKLPASWTGKLVSTTPTTPDFRAEFYNSDITMADDYTGSLVSGSVQVRTGGSPQSWKITTTANASEVGPFMSTYGEKQILGTGSAVTLTAEILHDSVTALTNAEIWIEGYFLGTAGQALGSFTSDRRATVLTTAAAKATSTATWTTTGMTNPNKQKLAVSFTPQVAGSLMWRVAVAKPSKTVLVDLAVTVA